MTKRAKVVVVIAAGGLTLVAALLAVLVSFSVRPPREGDFTPTPTPAPTSPDLPASTQAIIDRLDWGNIAFNAPDRMKWGEASTIQLVLSPRASIEELKRQVQAAGEKEGARIRVSGLMEARLSGTGFRISPVNPETQVVTRDEVTEWKWEIVPTREGRNNLYLTLTAVVESGAGVRPYRVRTFDKTIQVEVSGWQAAFVAFRENWEWMWTLVVLPIGAWAWRRQKRAALQAAAGAEASPSKEESKPVEVPHPPATERDDTVEGAVKRPFVSKAKNRKGKRNR